MTCLNAIMLAPDHLLLGADSLATAHDRRNCSATASEVEKLHQVSPSPVFIGGRGSAGITIFAAGMLRQYPRLLDLPSEKIARRLTRWFRLIAWFGGLPRDRDEMQLLIAGWSPKRGSMRVDDFRQTSRSEGFRIDASWPEFIGPDLPDAPHLTSPRTVSAMFELLAAQVSRHRANGLAAGPPLVVLELTPGRVERFTRADLDAEPSAEEIAADERIARERRRTSMAGGPGFAGGFSIAARSTAGTIN